MTVTHLTKKALLASGISGLALFGIANAQPAGRQPGQQPGQPPAAAPQAADVSDEQMDKTAEAYVVVIDIHNDVQEKMSGMDDQEEIQKHVQKAQEQMLEAIKAAGLEPAEYEQVMTQVTQDNELRTKFVALLEEKRNEDG